MASKLLNVLNEIEESRQLQIKNARDAGFNMPDNASFTSLATTIGTADYNTPAIDSPLINKTEWVRPTEWPDCESILTTAEDRDGFKPSYIVLLDATKETETVLPAYKSSSSPGSNSNQLTSTGAAGYLLSDGTWYNDTTNDITHVWDQSQDIVVTDGAFPGTYRWILCYMNPTKTPSWFCLQTWHLVEVIIGTLAVSNVSNLNNSSYNGFICGYGNGPYRNILNFKVLSTSNLRRISWQYGMSWQLFAYCRQLRNVDWGPIDQLRFSSTNGQVFPRGDSSLIHADMLDANTYAYLDGCYSLQTLKAINLTSSSITIYDSTPSLHTINAPSANIVLQSNIMRLPANVNYNVLGLINLNNIPLNWPEIPVKILTRNAGIRALIYYPAYPIQRLDFTYCTNFNNPTDTVVTNTGTNYTTIDSYTLREITFPNDVACRVQISALLTKASIIDLFNKLRDVSAITATLPNIIIPKATYDGLEATDIAIATNKGWNVLYE